MAPATRPLSGLPPPVVDAVLRVLRKAGPNQYSIDDEGKKALLDFLGKMAGTDELPANIRELVTFSFFLKEKMNSPAAAESILDVIEVFAQQLSETQTASPVVRQQIESAKNQVAAFLGNRGSLENLGKAKPAGATKWWEMKR